MPAILQVIHNSNTTKVHKTPPPSLPQLNIHIISMIVENKWIYIYKRKRNNIMIYTIPELMVSQ
jgi:hypothetical protein